VHEYPNNRQEKVVWRTTNSWIIKVRASLLGL